MKLDNFILEEYNENKAEHKKTISEISSDGDSRMYLGDLKTFVDFFKNLKNQSLLNILFIAYYNREPIGFITISDIGDYEICYGLRPKCRGEYLGSLLLQEFSEKVFERYENIDELKLFIDELNISSKKTAELAGYQENDNDSYSMRRM